MHKERRHAARRVGAFLQDAAGVHKATDKLVRLFVEHLGAVQLCRRVAPKQLVVGIVCHRPHRRRQVGVGIVQDFVFPFPETCGAR